VLSHGTGFPFSRRSWPWSLGHITRSIPARWIEIFHRSAMTVSIMLIGCILSGFPASPCLPEWPHKAEKPSCAIVRRDRHSISAKHSWLCGFVEPILFPSSRSTPQQISHCSWSRYECFKTEAKKHVQCFQIQWRPPLSARNDEQIQGQELLPIKSLFSRSPITTHYPHLQNY
jgi:hypothetical protein